MARMAGRLWFDDVLKFFFRRIVYLCGRNAAEEAIHAREAQADALRREQLQRMMLHRWLEVWQ